MCYSIRASAFKIPWVEQLIYLPATSKGQLNSRSTFVNLPILEVKMKSPYFINLENILTELGISRTNMYQRIRAGTFPEIVKLGIRSLGWSSEEFQDVVNAIRAGLTDYEMRELVRCPCPLKLIHNFC